MDGQSKRFPPRLMDCSSQTVLAHRFLATKGVFILRIPSLVKLYGDRDSFYFASSRSVGRFVPVLILKLWDEMMVPCDGHSGRRPTSCFPFALLIDLHTIIAKIAQSGIQAQARVGGRLDGVGGTCSAWRKQKSYKSALAA